MFRRRGVTLTKALLTVVCMLAAPLTQAISVGNLTFSLPSETDFVSGNDSNLLIVFYVQIMPDDLVMQLHRF